MADYPEGFQELVPLAETAPANSITEKVPPNPMNQRIAQAAYQRGVDPEAALTIWRSEGSVTNPNVKNPRSSATGIFQFISGTWKGMGGTDSDRLNLDKQIEYGLRLTKMNSDGLESHLGRKPQTWEVYLAHQQGLGGARSLLSSDPSVKAASLVGEKAVVQNGGTADMTAGQFINHIQGYVAKHSSGEEHPIPPAQRQATIIQTVKNLFAPSEAEAAELFKEEPEPDMSEPEVEPIPISEGQPAQIPQDTVGDLTAKSAPLPEEEPQGNMTIKPPVRKVEEQEAAPEPTSIPERPQTIPKVTRGSKKNVPKRGQGSPFPAVPKEV